MGPKETENDPRIDLFRNRLENLIDQRHELIGLSELIDWEVFDRQWGLLYEDRKGAPALRTRLVAGLHYLKHIYKLSDEQVVARWVENPYWQVFCGETYFQHEVPCHPTSLTRWRQRIGEEGCEWLLTQTIEAAKGSGALKKHDIKKVTVDTTVQEKAVTFPTDSKLLEAVRRHLVKACKDHELSLRQNYNRVAKRLGRQISGYGHAGQYRRMHKTITLLRRRVGRVVRDIERQLAHREPEVHGAFADLLTKAHRLLNQKQHDSNKLYSVHAPEVECIAKGKAHKRYEFGVKASFATTNKNGFVVGARSYPNNPYDGHTLEDQLQQVETLTAIKPIRCYVDRGYRGHGIEHTEVYIAGQRRGVTKSIYKELKRRNAIEPEIGHMKNDGHLGRNYLKGPDGDAMNVLLVASGHNLRKVLAWLRARSFCAWILRLFKDVMDVMFASDRYVNRVQTV
ncbi:MAG: IS5 family transposase [Nitrospirales bacterium]|nr:MAG: IS5 family transposase [Nitrospirales bacterium]